MTAAPRSGTKLHRARAELTLGWDSSYPLRHLPLRPDPLSSFARAMAQVRPDEQAEVLVDLAPITPGRRRKLLRATAAAERRKGQGAPNGLAALVHALNEDPLRPSRTRRPPSVPAGSMELLEARAETRFRLAKLSSTEPLFGIQVLVWAASPVRARAVEHVHALVACFGQFADQNHFRAVGLNLGFVHLGGSDSIWRRWRFDERAESGLFRPAKDAYVTTSEIAGMLKPPTKHCRTANVVRSGGVIPPPPLGLPTFRREGALLPLGVVREQDGERMVGLPLKETLFTAHFGRSGFGKALALDTPIPTPSGWTTMGGLTPGDVVFDQRGDPVTVIGTSDVMVDHDCYEVVFSDGSTIVADAEHVWATQTYDERRYAAAEAARPRAAGAGPEELASLRSLAAAASADALVTRRELVGLVGRRRPIETLTAGVRPSKVVAVPGRGNNPGAYPMAELVERLIGGLSQPRNDQRHKRLPPRGLRTTEEIRASLTNRGAANHSVEVCGPLRYPTKTLPINPYVLGAWLGDGTSANGGITCADPQILEEIRAAGYEVRHWCAASTTRPYSWGIVGIGGHLRALGVLGAKHIPRLYLSADVEQRTALLQGLMDTDGSVSAGGSCELSLTNPQLADDAMELVVGLGIKATMSTGRARLQGRDCGSRYRITFIPNQTVFRLSSKRARQGLDRRRSSVVSRRYITEVRPVPSVPVRCMAVDSPSHLFLAGRSCIPTHNTEEAIVQAVGIARGGVAGVLYNDPHGDALDRMAPYLTDHAERIVEVNLSRTGDLQAGWNPLSMQGCGPADIEAKVGTVASAFAAALSWTDRNTRALNLVAQATQSLCELALQLPPEIAPTIFQIVTILADDDWRREVVPFLSRTSQSFWATRFARQSGGESSITPVTNALDRLRARRAVAGLFGQSRSTFDLRTALDEGKIVLLSPGGVGDLENLIHALFLFGLFSATLSRRDMPAHRRRICHAFLDELQVADSGQASELVARMLREGRKFGLRLHAMVQQPTSLSKVTLTAMLTNRSHLFSTVVSHESAAVLSKEWASLVDARTITRLPRYHFLASATLGGEVTPPFLVRGLTVEEVWGDVACPDAVAEMRKTIDRTMSRRPMAEVLADLDRLDGRIVEHLRARRTRPEPERRLDEGNGRPAVRSDHVRHLRRH